MDTDVVIAALLCGVATTISNIPVDACARFSQGNFNRFRGDSACFLAHFSGGCLFIYISAAWARFIVATIDLKGYFGRLVDSKYMRKMGAWSYSVYLFHWLVFMHLQTRFQNGALAMLAAIVISSLIGAAAYRYLEMPLERMRHRLQARFLARGEAGQRVGILKRTPRA